MSKKIKIKYFDSSIQKVEKIKCGDWIDLRAGKEINLIKGEYATIPLNVAMELPKGYEAIVVPRSSTFQSWGILQTNGVGIIDSKYCGDNDQWRMPVYATRDVQIAKGDRICQFRIQKSQPRIRFQEVERLENADRGGLGSTGTN